MSMTPSPPFLALLLHVLPKPAHVMCILGEYGHSVAQAPIGHTTRRPTMAFCVHTAMRTPPDFRTEGDAVACGAMGDGSI